jgi:hypothetical protein
VSSPFLCVHDFKLNSDVQHVPLKSQGIMSEDLISSETILHNPEASVSKIWPTELHSGLDQIF